MENSAIFLKTVDNYILVHNQHKRYFEVIPIIFTKDTAMYEQNIHSAELAKPIVCVCQCFVFGLLILTHRPLNREASDLNVVGRRSLDGNRLHCPKHSQLFDILIIRLLLNPQSFELTKVYCNNCFNFVN